MLEQYHHHHQENYQGCDTTTNSTPFLVKDILNMPDSDYNFFVNVKREPYDYTNSPAMGVQFWENSQHSGGGESFFYNHQDAEEYNKNLFYTPDFDSFASYLPHHHQNAMKDSVIKIESPSEYTT